MYPRPTPGQRVMGAQSPLRQSSFVGKLVDVVNEQDRRQLGDHDNRPPLETPTDTVKIKNLTGGDLSRFRVVQLGASLLDDIDFRNIWVEGNAVAYPCCTRYAILREPIKSTKIGLAQVSGVCVARVNVTDDLHRYAKPSESSAILTSCAIGPIELLSTPDGETEQDIIVRLCIQSEDAFAKCGGISANSSGTVTFWKMAADGTLSATAMTETAQNWTGGAITADKLLRVRRNIGGRLVIVGEDCS